MGPSSPPVPARRVRVLEAASLLSRGPWWGEGERVTTAGRAAVSAARMVTTVPLSLVSGLVKGVFLGGLMGGSVGALGGGTVAFDAGNRLTGGSKPAGASAAAPAAAAAVSAGADAPPPAYLAALSTRLKALSALDAEAREEDAAREVARMEAPGSNAYDVLCVPPDAPADAVSRAHKLLSLAYHPDRNPAPSSARASAAINAAAALVSDPSKRAAYDAGGRTRAAADAVAGEGTSTQPTLEIKSSVVGRTGGFLGGLIGGTLGLGVGAAVGGVGGAVGSAASEASAAWGARQKVRTAGDTVVLAVAEAAKRGVYGVPPVPLRVEANAGGALRLALRAGRARLPPPAPARVPDVAALLEPTFRPSAAYLRRIGACAGAGEAAAFGERLAAAAASVAAAARQELSLPEPPLDGAEGDGGGDATGMGGGDTYEDAAARAAARHGGAITSMNGLLKMAFREAGEQFRGAAAKAAALRLAELGAAWEAASRGRAPSREWLQRRVQGILGGAGQGGGEAGGGSGEAILDPDHGWPAEAAAAPATAEGGRFLVELRAAGEREWVPAGALPDAAEGAEEVSLDVPLPSTKMEVRITLSLQREGKPADKLVVAEGSFTPQ